MFDAIRDNEDLKEVRASVNQLLLEMLTVLLPLAQSWWDRPSADPGQKGKAVESLSAAEKCLGDGSLEKALYLYVAVPRFEGSPDESPGPLPKLSSRAVTSELKPFRSFFSSRVKLAAIDTAT